MSPVTNASRRLLLKLPVLASTSALLLSACEGSLDKKTAKATGVMSKQLRFPEQAAHLGQRYLATAKQLEPLTTGELSLAILAQIGIDITESPLPDNEAIQTALSQAVRADFTDENVVITDGWMLSKTEAMLCVLVLKTLPKA